MSIGRKASARTATRRPSEGGGRSPSGELTSSNEPRWPLMFSEVNTR